MLYSIRSFFKLVRLLTSVETLERFLFLKNVREFLKSVRLTFQSERGHEKRLSVT